MDDQRVPVNLWQLINRTLSPRRLSYGLFTGAALWLAWLISISLGPGNLDLANQVVGTDYIQFYTSGLTLRQGDQDLLYDFKYQSQLELTLAGPELDNFHAFLTPPFFAWLFVPFSYLSYVWSFIIWSLLNLLGLYASIHLLGVEHTSNTFLWALCWFPIFAAVSFGQNSLLTILILSATYLLWKKDRGMLCGLIASLLLFKPQLLLGISILWLIRWRKDWKALLGLLTGTGILGAITFLFLPSAARHYLDLAVNFLPDMIYQDQFPLYHLHALRGFWILLFPGKVWLAETLSLLLSLAGIVVFIRFVRRNSDRPSLGFAGAIGLTILITPHAMIYDWALLLIPATLLWQEVPGLQSYWKAVYSVLWLVTLLSGPLTYLQLQSLPHAIQISVPVYLLISIDILRSLDRWNSTNDTRLSSSP